MKKLTFTLSFLLKTILSMNYAVADCRQGIDSCGTCGTDCIWEKAGTALTITGQENNAVLQDYGNYESPWGTDITSVTINGNFDTLGKRAFKYAKSLEYVDIKGSIKNINTAAFHDTSITRIDLPDGIETIARETFSKNSLLEHISIPNTMVSIGAWAFQHSGLTEIEIPNGVKNIGGGAFDDCTNLKKLVIPDSVETFAYEDEQYGYLTFNGVNLTELTVGADNLTKYLNAGGEFNETEDLNITCLSGNCQTALEAWDEAHNTNYASRAKTIITNTDGSKTIYDLNGHFIAFKGKRIYTIDEANKVAGDKNRISIRYR
ncbi:MAG: leucine-rich repeat domain-containing protein [Alphaproteobacteria bacterium]|nr:leucine-rich repeat domain-containing protein [Alphaproteobacteria bacterium]